MQARKLVIIRIMSSSEQPNLTIRPRIVPASLTYASLVFAGGFVCGMIRVPILLPLIGVRYAELVEMPIMAFILCYVAAHLALDLLDEEQAEAILTYCEEHLKEEPC